MLSENTDKIIGEIESGCDKEVSYSLSYNDFRDLKKKIKDMGFKIGRSGIYDTRLSVRDSPKVKSVPSVEIEEYSLGDIRVHFSVERTPWKSYIYRIVAYKINKENDDG